MSRRDRSARRLVGMAAAMAGLVLLAAAPAQGASGTAALCTVVPLVGNCATAPLSKVRVAVAGPFRGA